MTGKVVRESDGNVVVRSGDFALRFFRQWGGTPLEFWKDNYPLLTNANPGSGTSVTWETGQDPTQASCDGLTSNPIALYLDPSTIHYNYYIREMPGIEAGFYGVWGFAPDFWLSHEWQDDYAIGQWYRKYHDPKGLGFWNIPSSTVCAGSEGCFFPGNEMTQQPGSPAQPRRYAGGRFAGKVTVNFTSQYRQNDRGGITFRNVGPNTAGSGYDFTVAPTGKYKCERRDSRGRATILAQGYLSKPDFAKMFAGGIELEVRTDNGGPGFAVLINGRSVGVISDTKPHMGEYCGLTARTASLIGFSYRQFFDVGTEFSAIYTPGFNNTITGNYIVRLAAGVKDPALLYRANLPCIMLNQTTFPVRHTAVKPAGSSWENRAGICSMKEGDEFWAGAPDGSHGLKARVNSVYIDGKVAREAHAQIVSHGANDEFVMQFNPLPFGNINPIPIREISSSITWSTFV